MRARIVATGSYTPKKVVTNLDLEKIVDTTDKWIKERSGIEERRIADSKEAASDLAYEAAKAAFKKTKIKPEDIDLIITATITGDMPFPSTSCFLQNKLGVKNTAAFDLNAACSGFLYGISVADSFIRSGKFKRILLVGVELLSRITDWEDRSTCVLFGDGAGAVIIEATKEDRGIISTKLGADGSMWELLYMPAGGSRNPATKDTVKKRMHYVKMKGNETFKVAVRTLETLVIETLEENKLKPSQLSLLIPHQANLRIIQATADRLGLPQERVFVNLNKYGNTSAASIAIALDEAVQQDRIKNGDYIMLEAFGGGLTWASVLIKW
ncbi:MAG: ketoacyl-ACP synthase III [Nitrospiraceae bacterium]|nr:ketoacyl-ACP synthase III [Nitrospiraceae bacterium]